MATVIKGSKSSSFQQLYNNMQNVENQIEEGDYVELYLELDKNNLLYNRSIVNSEVATLESAMAAKNVTKWPDRATYTSIEQDGKVIKIRWVKGFLWLLIVIPLIFAIMVAALVYLAFWELNKYSPILKGATSKFGVFLAIGAFLLVVFPAILMANPSQIEKRR